MITKKALEEWNSLDKPLRSAVTKRLTQLASGRWSQRVKTARHTAIGTSLLKVGFSKRKGGGRILFEKDVAYSQTLAVYTQVLRVWAIVRHKDQTRMIRMTDEAIQEAASAHDKGLRSNAWERLRVSLSGGSGPVDADGMRLVLPCTYEHVGSTASLSATPFGDTTSERGGSSRGGPGGSSGRRAGGGTCAEPSGSQSGEVSVYPPAVPQTDAYTLEKYGLFCSTYCPSCVSFSGIKRLN